MMLDRKEIQVIFLFELTMGHKSTNTTHNINNAFAQELLNGSAVQSWFKKFCKGDESLEDEESSGQPSAGNNSWEQSLKLILLQLHEKLSKSSVSTILQSLSFWSKLKGEKAQ